VEQAGHCLRRFQVPLGIARQPPPRPFERRLVPDAREHVVERPVDWFRESHAVGGDDRQMKRRGEVQQRVIVRFLVAKQMTLELDAHVVGAERADQPIDQAAHTKPRGVDCGTTGQRNETADVSIELVERERSLAFRRAKLHLRHEAAEIAIPLA
jgi:hypothetical protein